MRVWAASPASGILLLLVLLACSLASPAASLPMVAGSQAPTVTPVPAQTPPPPTPAQSSAQGPLHTASQQELDIIKVLLAQERAWNTGDLDSFAKGYKNSPNTLFIGDHISRGYDQMLSDYHRHYPTAAAMGTLSFSELEVHPLDEKYAVVLGTYRLNRSRKEHGNASGLFTLTFEKTAEGWKIIIDHTT